MYQEIIAFVILGIAIAFLIKKFFFKSKSRIMTVEAVVEVVVNCIACNQFVDNNPVVL